MERDRAKVVEKLNFLLKISLEFWQDHPESAQAIRWFNEDVSQVDKEKLGSTIKVFADKLETSEGSRALLPNDLKKWFRREGEFLVAEFHPKKSERANAQVRAEKIEGKGYLMILNNEYGEYSHEAILFPDEIAEITVKRANPR